MTDGPYDVIIIGAGIIGCSTALALSRKGYRTLNVDRLPAAGYGSTSGSAAIIRPYYSTVEGTALAYEGHFHWKNWGEFLGLKDDAALARYNQCGCLVLMGRDSDRLASTRHILDTVGVPYQLLGANEVTELMPAIVLDSFAPPKRIDDPDFGVPNGATLEGAMVCPTGGYINDPQLACRNLQQAALALGATFRFNSEVTEIRQQNGKVVGITLNGSERIDAPVLVNIAGPHSSHVNDMAGVRGAMSIQTRALRQEVAHIPAPAELDFTGKGHIMTDGDTGVYMRPELGNHMFIGTLEPACDPLEWVDPDAFDASFTDQWTNLVWRAAQRFPTLGIPNKAEGIVALYDVSDDWIPIYDRSDLDGYFMAIGTSGNQFKNAPVVGQMMAELIEYCGNGGDHDRQPLRFHLKHVDREISLGFFSRNRPVHAESSFSVLG